MNTVEIIKIAFVALGALAVIGFVSLILALCRVSSRADDQARKLMSELDATLAPGPFLKLYTVNGILNLRGDRISSYRYDVAWNSLVIEDGLADPIVLRDPDRKLYHSLEEQITAAEKERG